MTDEPKLTRPSNSAWYAGLPIIAVCQRKGGPGKTTLARMLAEYLALLSKLRVLLLDFDTQCSLSHLFLEMEVTKDNIRPPVHPDFVKEGLRYSSAELFNTGKPVPYVATRPRGDHSIDLLPGDKLLLRAAERMHETDLKEKVENRTLEFVNGCEGQLSELYDVMIIDTAPADSPLTLSGLRAATHMLIPLEFEEQCFKGMRDMLNMWHKENELRPAERRLEILAIQPNKVKLRRKLQNKYYKTLQSSSLISSYLSPVLIPDRGEFAERDAQDASPISIFQLPTTNEARIYAEQFGAYVSSKLFGTPYQHRVPTPRSHARASKPVRSKIAAKEAMSV